MNRLPLHQDLYLIAHDQSGKLLVHPASMGLGLAGAAMLELALAGRVAVARGRVAASVPSRPAADPADAADDFSGDLLALVTREPGDVRTPVKKAAGAAYERTREALVAAGVLRRTTKRVMGLLPTTRYLIADIASVVRASSGARSAVEGWRQPDARCAALCGLVAALRLEEELYLDQPSGRLAARLREIAREGSREVAELVGVVETLVGEAAVAVYR
ncbi:GPP34 family phosphoprotein [Actinomadura sp. ATCC 31491]|uniref:GPP34 family phosphoprotein n=1 Tax=Actinomadura luzonensis TaxID=2805427 RepID=A0ABT0G794_9ACTN|nr:GPP34 family phosphoprotein [Actinomadura luzonensis]MCK2220095.1 GPP34 family phosphoprotein [Actinomadura luzonensis]